MGDNEEFTIKHIASYTFDMCELALGEGLKLKR